MELAELLHGAFEVRLIFGIAHARMLHIFCNLIPVIRIDIDDVVANMQRTNGLVDTGFISPINQAIRSLPRNAHNIARTLVGKQERPVRHTLL